MYAALAPASRPARRAPQLRWVPALTPAPFAWAARRKQEEQKLQRPAAYRPGERRASFSPPPLRRPWEAQPPLRVAAAHSHQNNASEEDCFFCLANPTPREVRMQLIIAGSRTFTDYQLLCQTLALERSRITQVLTGGARGADQLGYRWAWKHQVKHQLFRADWERFGKAAGVRRNHQMAQAGDLLVVLGHTTSPGTAHLIQCMRALGKPVVLSRVEATA